MGMRAPLSGLTLALAAAFLPAAGRAAPAATPALEVGALKVSEEELQGAIALDFTLNSFHKTPDAAAVAAARKKVAGQLSVEMLLASLAARRKLPLDETRVAARYAAVEKSYGGARGFEKLLTRAKTNPAFYRRQLAWQVQADALVEAEARRAGELPEAQIRKHFDDNRQRYQMPASFHVVAALVKLDPGRLSQQGYRDTLQATAANIAERMRAGESIEALAKDYTMAEIKDLGFAHTGALVPELAEAVEKLEVGKVAGPIKAFQGYFAVKLLGKKPPQPLAFEQVRGAISAELEKSRRAALRLALIEEARAKFEVKQSSGEPEAR
ncbi:MAG: peptidyl-prolyl cis-trans isomerase [Deltaproteobacteria bacterium]|nr:peptidyl-prolyl cis-trans isomerase [Deltaproteobacteria bacterium]